MSDLFTSTAAKPSPVRGSGTKPPATICGCCALPITGTVLYYVNGKPAHPLCYVGSMSKRKRAAGEPDEIDDPIPF